MKKFLTVLSAMLCAIFMAGCPTDDGAEQAKPAASVRIRFESSPIIMNVHLQDKYFRGAAHVSRDDYPGNNSLPETPYYFYPGESSSKVALTEPVSGYIYFVFYVYVDADPDSVLIRDYRAMTYPCYTKDLVVVNMGEDAVFVFTDNTLVIDAGDSSNIRTLTDMEAYIKTKIRESILPKPAVTVFDGNNSINASWQAAAGATEYRVYCDSGYSPGLVMTVTGTSVNITGLSGGSYHIWVQAVNNSGATSPLSTAASGLVRPNGDILGTWKTPDDDLTLTISPADQFVQWDRWRIEGSQIQTVYGNWTRSANTLTLTSDEQGAFGTAGLTQPGTLTLTYTGGEVELLKDI